MNRRDFVRSTAVVSAAAVVGLRLDTQASEAAVRTYKTWFVKPGMEYLIQESEARTGYRFDHAFVGQKLRWLSEGPMEFGDIFQVLKDHEPPTFCQLQEKTLITRCWISSQSPWEPPGVNYFSHEPLAEFRLTR